MSLSFREFLIRRYGGTISEDAAWRAYDIPASTRPEHTSNALKHLRLGYVGELAVSHIGAMHGLNSADTRTRLAEWWVWRRVSGGRRLWGLKKRVYSPSAPPELPP